MGKSRTTCYIHKGKNFPNTWKIDELFGIVVLIALNKKMKFAEGVFA